MPLLSKRIFEATGVEFYNRVKKDPKYASLPKVTEKLITSLAACDPGTNISPDGKIRRAGGATEALLRLYVAEDPSFLRRFKTKEGKRKIKEALAKFSRYKKLIRSFGFPGEIAKCSSFAEIEEQVNLVEATSKRHTTQKDKGKAESFALNKNIVIWAENDTWILQSPLNRTGAILLGKDTDWCTAYPTKSEYFKHYFNFGRLFVFSNKNTDRKYQYSNTAYNTLDDYSFNNEYNRSVGPILAWARENSVPCEWIDNIQSSRFSRKKEDGEWYSKLQNLNALKTELFGGKRPAPDPVTKDMQKAMRIILDTDWKILHKKLQSDPDFKKFSQSVVLKELRISEGTAWDLLIDFPASSSWRQLPKGDWFGGVYSDIISHQFLSSCYQEEDDTIAWLGAGVFTNNSGDDPPPKVPISGPSLVLLRMWQELLEKTVSRVLSFKNSFVFVEEACAVDKGIGIQELLKNRPRNFPKSLIDLGICPPEVKTDADIAEIPIVLLLVGHELDTARDMISQLQAGQRDVIPRKFPSVGENLLPMISQQRIGTPPGHFFSVNFFDLSFTLRPFYTGSLPGFQGIPLTSTWCNHIMTKLGIEAEAVGEEVQPAEMKWELYKNSINNSSNESKVRFQTDSIDINFENLFGPAFDLAIKAVYLAWYLGSGKDYYAQMLSLQDKRDAAKKANKDRDDALNSHFFQIKGIVEKGCGYVMQNVCKWLLGFGYPKGRAIDRGTFTVLYAYTHKITDLIAAHLFFYGVLDKRSQGLPLEMQDLLPSRLLPYSQGMYSRFKEAIQDSEKKRELKVSYQRGTPWEKKVFAAFKKSKNANQLITEAVKKYYDSILYDTFFEIIEDVNELIYRCLSHR